MFDPNMTYWQSLRIVARGLVQWPTSRYEIEQLADGVKEVLWLTIGPMVRLLLLIALPISAPLVTLLVQYGRRKKAKRTKSAQPQGDKQ